jgi:HD-GYP domain-containing protein (c-di-GMP phosphodiesterase class II)
MLSHPVYIPHKKELLPAGSEVTEENIRVVILLNDEEPSPPIALFEHGSVKKDILRLIQRNPFCSIFSEETRKRRVLELMDRVEVAPVVLEVLDYFKNNDPYTYRHKLMVFALSALLAQYLVEDSKDMLREATAGPCHDFGKTNVPLKILKKRDPLTRNEKKLLEHHAIAGYVLLAYYLQDEKNLSARVARDHHERRDGSGYPLGITLKDRLVEIVAVSDIYDALIASRPYRPEPFDNRTALEEITEIAHRGAISRDIMCLLVALNRQDKPHYMECTVSVEKRGNPPVENVYGITLSEDTLKQNHDSD